VHVNLRKSTREGASEDGGEMQAFTRPVAPYVVPVADGERRSYYAIRVPAGRGAAELSS
jgi:hypothetical protein